MTATPHPVVLGTAGHIDHGKTSLVRALTGIDTDRLPVEKQRGITTELGFAHLDLDGQRVAVVDVPGHERFVKSMVAGAAGLDLVMLVIAADEGVMPQTREHLDICQLLAVRGGLVVLTKRDLVDDEWLGLVTEEVRGWLAGSTLAGAPILPVSARTGAGMDALRAAIAAAIAAAPPRPSAGVFRLPVDRVFTVHGFGTVVTGTVLGGRIAPGDEVVVLPSGLSSRTRGVQVHGAAVERAVAGHRAAVNLASLAVEQLARGDVLVRPGEVEPTHILDVRFRHLAAARTPLPARSRVLLHHGATQLDAVLELATASLPPGGESLGQLRLDSATPLAALPGDHFIVRGFVPLADHGTTLGGGEILRVHAARLRRATERVGATMALVGAGLDARLLFEVRAAHAAGHTAGSLGPRLGQPAAALRARLEALGTRGELVAAGDGDGAHWLHAEVVAELEARALAALDAAVDRRLPREELRSKLPAALPARAFEVVVAGLGRRGVAVDGEALRRERRVAAPALAPYDAALLARFDGWGLEPPRPRELAAVAGLADAEVQPALNRLLAGKALVKVKPDLFVGATAITALRQRLLAFLDAHGEVTAQQWKELTGTSRKYSIPLAEYFDAEKVTLRVGEIRRRRG